MHVILNLMPLRLAEARSRQGQPSRQIPNAYATANAKGQADDSLMPQKVSEYLSEKYGLDAEELSRRLHALMFSRMRL